MSRLKGFAAYEGVLPAVTYSPAIQLLCKEHSKLRKSMEDTLKFALKGSSVCTAAFIKEWLERTRKLRAVWSLHTLKEEQVLLAILTKYVDSDRGPLAVMRYEHERLEHVLDQFVQRAEALHLQPSDEKLLGEALSLFQNAARILGDHCYKEEKTIFALAQNMLSDAEKIHMLQQLRKIR